MNYSEIVTAIQSNTEDDSAELLAYIPTAIQLAEDRIYRDARELPYFRLEDTGAMVSGTGTLTLPTNSRVIRSVSITVGTSTVYLESRKDSYLQDYAPDTSVTGEPKFYANKDETTLLIAPTPDQNYAYEVKHQGIPERLTSGNPTTWLATNEEDVVLCACMVEASANLKHPEEVAVWEGKYQSALAQFVPEIQRTHDDEYTAGA